MKAKDPRRSDRVSLTVPIEISGTATAGSRFAQEARTVVISRHGARIVVDRKLTPGEQITIRCVGTDKEATARVVGQIGGQPRGYVYGVVLLDPTVDLWSIKFPAATESKKPVVRLMLECTVCESREVAHLNELEAEVFQANRSLSRACKKCNEWTPWKQPFEETPVERNLPLDQPSPVPVSPLGPAPQTRNRRKDTRIRPKMIACIRQPGFGEEVVLVENLSRGGLSFLSKNEYFEGSRIEVAVPYTLGAPNIFVPARIVRCRTEPSQGLTQYGVAYIA